MIPLTCVMTWACRTAWTACPTRGAGPGCGTGWRWCWRSRWRRWWPGVLGDRDCRVGLRCLPGGLAALGGGGTGGAGWSRRRCPRSGGCCGNWMAKRRPPRSGSGWRRRSCPGWPMQSDPHT